MTVPVISHEEAVSVGTALRGRYSDARMVLPNYNDDLGWGDVVQFVLLKAREVVVAREALVDRQLRDSEVSRAPSTRTIGDIRAELRS